MFKCESTSRCFQPGEVPSRGFLCDYKPLCGSPFEALVAACVVCGGVAAGTPGRPLSGVGLILKMIGGQDRRD